MTLREDLKDWIPMYLWEEINHPEGYIVSNEEFNMRWNLTQKQGDQQANTIRDILLMLYETILNDTDGASHIRVNLPEYSNADLKTILKNIDTRLKTNATTIANHKTSTDHDFRYYTKTQLDAGQLDVRYFTKTQLVNGQLDTRYFTKTQLNNGQLDTRYYTKQELIPWLQGGDTSIKEEVFTIISPNNGDGTFTYAIDGPNIQGQLGPNNAQIFKLTTGHYEPGKNRIEILVNDTLRRSARSGGLIEVDPTHVGLAQPEAAGAEITVKYYERIAIAAEYNIRMGTEKPPFSDGKTIWFRIVG